MKVGSLVECIYDGLLPHTIQDGENVIKGEIYTISAFIANGHGVHLEEIISDSIWHGFDISRFREIQPPIEINIEELMLEKQPA